MRNSIWEKRISTFLALFMITIGIVATSFLVKRGTNFIGKAGPSELPQNILVTNISDTSFTVSYKTSDSVLGTISFGTDKNLGSNSLDDRDQIDGNVKNYNIHSITAKNLKPKTLYFFIILSGQNTFSNNGQSFEVTTGPLLENNPPDQLPLSGKTVLSNGSPPKEGIVYLTTEKSQTFSSLIKSDGSYIIPLNSLRSSDLTSYSILSKTQPLKMFFMAQDEESNVLISSKDINPVPLVTLSKDYDFTANNTPSASSSGRIGFPSLQATENIKDPKIIIPKEDQTFTDSQPLFKGTASPGASLKIIINSQTALETEVKADNNGSWTYRPTNPLSVGEHTISIITKDKFGISKTITQAFTVYAQGSQVTESATPSATPTLTITPTLLPTITVFPTITPFPTTTLIPAPTSTPIPLNTPIPTIAPSGNSSVATFGVLGAITTSIGILLFLLTRGGVPL